ncbi:MAG TPA: VOC family protein [Bacteroidota bacterium]|nr:VOC family protein [Bacteroidota bacterium]
MMKSTHKIVPHLWFDKEAKEAAQFYCSIFPDARITNLTVLHDTPSGDCDIVSFELSGQSFMAISAGPLFRFNPSLSFIVNFDPSKDANARQHLDQMWEQLSAGGTALMPLDTYPFSEHYGWIQDKYGLSWQLMLTNPGGEERPFIVPTLLFVGAVCGKAEEATDFYLSVFSSNPNSGSDHTNTKRGNLYRYPKGVQPDDEGTIMFTDFMIGGEWFAAMDSAYDHKFAFNEAVSLLVQCESQEEIDYFWKALSAVPEAEQCGWLKDTYGVSWQITSTDLEEMMRHGSREQIDRITRAFLPMKKIDVAILKKAYEEAAGS